MKKVMIGLVSVVVVLCIAVVGVLTFDFNRFNKENVYVQVPAEDSVKVDEHKLSDGEIMRRYVYTVPAYNEAGEKIAVEFSAAKLLREGAYLMLYVKKGTTEVSSYDEVQAADLPDKVKSQF